MYLLQSWGDTLHLIVELLATAAFALSGLMKAAGKKLDAVGICVVAFLAAFGGGTLRDLLLDQRPFFWVQQALLHKPEASRDNPSPRRSYATAGTGTVAGRPSCVKRLSKATRTCSSVTWRSNVRAITRSPKRLKQCILVSTRLLR